MSNIEGVDLGLLDELEETLRQEGLAPRIQKDGSSNFTRGLKSSAASVDSSLKGVEGLVSGREDLMQSAKLSQMRSAKHSGDTSDFTDIDSVGDAVDWAAFQAGNAIGSLGTSLVGGGFGGAVAKSVAKNAVNRELKQRAGLAGGMFATTYPQQLGETANKIHHETGEMDFGIAPLTAAAGAMLDMLPVMRELDKLGLASKAKSSIVNKVVSNPTRLKQFAKSLGGTMAAEGSTEAAQELLSLGALEYVNSAKDHLGTNELKGVLNAFAAGTMGGATLGAPSALVQAYQSNDPWFKAAKQERDSLKKTAKDAIDRGDMDGFNQTMDKIKSVNEAVEVKFNNVKHQTINPVGDVVTPDLSNVQPDIADSTVFGNQLSEAQANNEMAYDPTAEMQKAQQPQNTPPIEEIPLPENAPYQNSFSDILPPEHYQETLNQTEAAPNETLGVPNTNAREGARFEVENSAFSGETKQDLLTPRTNQPDDFTSNTLDVMGRGGLLENAKPVEQSGFTHTNEIGDTLKLVDSDNGIWEDQNGEESYYESADIWPIGGVPVADDSRNGVEQVVQDQNRPQPLNEFINEEARHSAEFEQPINPDLGLLDVGDKERVEQIDSAVNQSYERAQSNDFIPTHETDTGQPVIKHPDDEGVFIDKKGEEWEFDVNSQPVEIAPVVTGGENIPSNDIHKVSPGNNKETKEDASEHVLSRAMTGLDRLEAANKKERTSLFSELLPDTQKAMKLWGVKAHLERKKKGGMRPIPRRSNVDTITPQDLVVEAKWRDAGSFLDGLGTAHKAMEKSGLEAQRKDFKPTISKMETVPDVAKNATTERNNSSADKAISFTDVSNELTKKGWADAIELLSAIKNKNPDGFNNLLKKGGTLPLRDLAERFRKSSLYVGGKTSRKGLAFDNDVDAIDSAIMHAQETKKEASKKPASSNIDAIRKGDYRGVVTDTYSDFLDSLDNPADAIKENGRLDNALFIDWIASQPEKTKLNALDDIDTKDDKAAEDLVKILKEC